MIAITVGVVTAAVIAVVISILIAVGVTLLVLMGVTLATTTAAIEVPMQNLLVTAVEQLFILVK